MLCSTEASADVLLDIDLAGLADQAASEWSGSSLAIFQPAMWYSFA